MFRPTRRRFAEALLAFPAAVHAQMASRGVAPVARGKSSGVPFLSTLTDVAAAAGLTRPVIYGDVDRNAYIVETIGCGAAFFDFDNDGWLDILLLTGSRWSNVPPGSTNRLYRNNRDGTFTDITEKSGLGLSGWFSGVTIADYNNDGLEDVFLTGWGQQLLFRNNGDGTFTDVTKAAGLAGDPGRWSTGCTFVDYDRDGHLDLFVSHYLKFDPKLIPAAGKDPACNFKGVMTNCGPRGLGPETQSLYRNNGDGTFTNVTESSGVGKGSGSYGLTAVAADFDDDGWPEIYVACDSSPSQLFKRKADGKFQEIGIELGVALNEDGAEQAGMGLGIGDYDLNGRLDILKTHFTEDTPALYLNQGAKGFEDVTIRSGSAWRPGSSVGEPALWTWTITACRTCSGLPGSVYPEMEKKYPQYPNRTPRVLFRNLGDGKFEELLSEAGPGVSDAHSSRGCAFGDFDNDGDLDILIVNLNEPPSLLRNDVRGSNRG